jgi:hypothetical protein
MKSMIAFVAFATFLVSGFAVAGDESGLKKSDVPEAVLKAFQISNPKAVANEFSMKTADGETVYEIETKTGELEKDFVYSEDGTLLQTDEDITTESLPDVIVESVKKAYPEGKIDEADKITKGSAIEFEVAVEVGETDYELMVASDGKIISSTAIGEDEDEPGDVDTDDEEDSD